MEVFPKAKVVLTNRDPENWYKSVKETIYQGNLDRQMFPVNIYSWVNGSSKQLNMMETFTHASNNRFNNGKYLWQYGLWSFQAGGTKLERFLHKNFEFWINGD